MESNAPSLEPDASSVGIECRSGTGSGNECDRGKTLRSMDEGEGTSIGLEDVNTVRDTVRTVDTVDTVRTPSG